MVKITKGKNRGIKGIVKKISGDGFIQIAEKGKKRMYVWSHQIEKVDVLRVCVVCGNSFLPIRNDPRIRFCSSECRYKNYKKIKKITGRDWRTPVSGVSPKKCPICSRIFYHNKRIYCSDSCSCEANSHRNRKSYNRFAQGFIARRCPECTLLFVTNQLIRKFCSEECAEENKRYRIIKKGEVCKHIYDTRNDPDSISNMIEDLTGVSCNRKILDEKEDHKIGSIRTEPWEITVTRMSREEGCVVCGLIRDRNGKYCRDCWMAIGKRITYHSHAVEALGKVDVTIEQKRKCLSCRMLPTCIEVGNVRDGCETVFKSLQNREAKRKIRSLTGVTHRRQGGS